MDFQDEELKEILNIFRTESEEIVGRLNNTLLELEKVPSNKDLMLQILRDAHSLKGAARMIGFNTVQDIAHRIEDIVELAKEDSLAFSHNTVDVIYKSVDLITEIIENSIETGEEKFNLTDVQNNINLLENIKQQQDNGAESVELKQTETSTKDTLIGKKEKIDFLFTQAIGNLVKLTENVEEKSIKKLFDNVNELVNIFQSLESFKVKEELENIKVKLDIVLKCSTGLSEEEVGELQMSLDDAIKYYDKLCADNGIKSIDLYEQAFSDAKNNSNKFDFEEIKKLLQELAFSTEKAGKIKALLSEFKEKNRAESFYPLLEKLINLLEYIDKTKLKPDKSQIEIMLNGLKYCFAIKNRENVSEDIELLIQQLSVVKQLLEMSSKVVNAEIVNEQFPNNTVKKQENKRGFSKFLTSDKIKTLHVDSEKLDAMVNQIGEIISAQIKNTKQLNELSVLEKKLEECSKEFYKLLHYIKLFDKKDLRNSEDYNRHIKQFISAFSNQNKNLNTISENLNKLQYQNLEDDMKMHLLIEDFDEMIKNVRVLPFAAIFHFFGRMVRDIASEQGKKIELSINGSETGADKKIVEAIKTPLIHVIRNSVDHGIETPQQRIREGKNPTGHIQINARHSDNKIIIEVVDDGQGFDIQKIKDTALKKGLLSEDEIEKMSEDEILNFVFIPGFSTNEKVTDISGRGVGMDVVKSEITQLNGTIDIKSEFGQGSKIIIELPVSVAAMPAFIVQCENQNFAIPLSFVRTVVYEKESDIFSNCGVRTILYNGASVPIFDLAEILKIKQNKNSGKFKTVLIIETDGKYTGIIVDKLIDEQKIIHKKLSPPIQKLKNISGITTLATGETCLILEVNDLIKTAGAPNILKIKNNNAVLIKENKNSIEQQRILIVDDSLTTRTLEKNILKKAGFDVETAAEPLEAIQKLEQNKFDMILSDIEMPNMSGLEFLTKIKENSLYADIPFIIISSFPDEETKRKALKQGAEKYIMKNDINEQSLINAVKNILS